MRRKNVTGGAGGGVAGSEYASVTVTSSSNAGTGKTNPFDEDDHGAFASVANLAAVGITFDETDGSFAPTAAGVYEIDLTMSIETDAVTAVTKVSIEQGASEEWTANIQLHSAFDPFVVAVSLLLTLGAGEKIQAFFDNQGTDNVNSAPGTTMTITRIA